MDGGPCSCPISSPRRTALLQYPGEEFHAIDLLGDRGVEVRGEVSGEAKSLPSGISVGGLGDAGEMLDAQAKREYKRRLLDLREELEELDHRQSSRRLADPRPPDRS